MKRFSKRAYEIIELADQDDKLSAVYDLIMMITILVSLVPLVFKQSCFSPEKIYEHNRALIEYVFWGEVSNDIRIYGTDFEVPVYFISGEQDYTCATSYSRKYYEDITAPDKAFYEIKGCGHSPHADKPEEVASIIAEFSQHTHTD